MVNKKMNVVLLLLMFIMLLASCSKREENTAFGFFQMEQNQHDLSESKASSLDSVPASEENKSPANRNSSLRSHSSKAIQPLFSEDVIWSIAKKYIEGGREWMDGAASLYFFDMTDETGCCYNITERTIEGGFQPWESGYISFTTGVYWFDGESLKLYRYEREAGMLGEKTFFCNVALNELAVVKRLEKVDIEDKVREKLQLQKDEKLYIRSDVYIENCFYAIVSLDDETGIVGWGEDPVYWIDSNGDLYEADKLTPNPNRKVLFIGNIYK